MRFLFLMVCCLATVSGLSAWDNGPQVNEGHTKIETYSVDYPIHVFVEENAGKVYACIEKLPKDNKLKLNQVFKNLIFDRNIKASYTLFFNIESRTKKGRTTTTRIFDLMAPIRPMHVEELSSFGGKVLFDSEEIQVIYGD